MTLKLCFPSFDSINMRRLVHICHKGIAFSISWLKFIGSLVTSHCVKYQMIVSDSYH